MAGVLRAALLPQVCHVDVAGDTEANRNMCILLNEVGRAAGAPRHVRGPCACFPAAPGTASRQGISGACSAAGPCSLCQALAPTNPSSPAANHPCSPRHAWQAYEVLMDPEQRTAYNAELDAALADEDDGSWPGRGCV